MAKEEDIRRQKTQDGANAATMRIATFTIFTFAILLAQIFAFGFIIGIFTIYLQFKKAAKVGA
jgi:hypothetical protein